ncbi:MAG: sensor histidine kinase [Bacilli bacterium]|nr:sensor histidine kinase [Bacilli bacterium]
MAKYTKGFSIGQSILISTFLIVITSLLVVTIGGFLNFNSTTSGIVESTSKEINKQIILNYENYIDSVINTANYIQRKTVEYGIEDRNDELKDIYIQAADLQQDIVSIVLVDIAGNEVINSSSKNLTDEDITQKRWYYDAISNAAIFHFSSPHTQDIYEDSIEEVITITKLIDFYALGIKHSGVLVIDLNTYNLVKLANTTNLGDQGHIIILNDDNSLIYASNSSCTNNNCESAIIAQDIIIGGQNVTINDLSMYANVNTLKNTRWRIATFINIELVENTRTSNIVFSGTIFVITLSITILVSTIISKRISSPVNKLKDHMQEIQKGNFYNKIALEGQKEIVVLASSFNSMIEEIRELMDTILVEQKEKRKTEFIALQTQINPHFLYNTLDSIVYLSENHMNEEVVEMVVALSKFFRISISRGKNIILLSEELEHARNYLLIQQIRYNKKFTFDFNIDENVKSCKVVKLILQPIIENAIYHGINTEYNEGSIQIRAYEKNKKLYLEVEDDGYGITPEKIQELKAGFKDQSKAKSVGVRNVYQRLQLYYGAESDFIIESELDVKTIIRLIIPIEKEV